MQKFIKEQPWTAALCAALSVIVLWLLVATTGVCFNQSRPLDALLVLGGSPLREAFAAALAKKTPTLLIVVSGGSPPVCIRKTFLECGAPFDKVLVECNADSTFGNFYYSIPLLVAAQVHKVGVVTSEGNEERGLTMARLALWSHGISVQNEVLPFEIGSEGHLESPEKTGLDILRSLLWAPCSLVYYPRTKAVSLSTLQDNHPAGPCKFDVPAQIEREYENYLNGKADLKRINQ